MKNKQVKQMMDDIAWYYWHAERASITNELVNGWYEFLAGPPSTGVNDRYVSLTGDQLNGK